MAASTPEATLRVADAASLEAAVERGAGFVEIDGVIAGLKRLRLPPGCRLRGASAGAELRFGDGQPGVMLSADNAVADIRLVTDTTQVALGLTDDTDDLGTLSISNVTMVGRVHLEGHRAVTGVIRLDRVHVEQADARMAAHRPAGFGVEALLGAITIQNLSRSASSRWTVEADALSAGTAERPVRGSGVFVFGGWSIPLDADMGMAPAPTQEGGGIDLRRLATGEIHSDGGIPLGTGNLISAGVFVGAGVHAREVVSEGTTTTYGPNDMVLDNWGRVNSWTARAKVTSNGSSGIGFVNFGDMDVLTVDAPIETHGLGARGFNLYDGTLRRARFHSIITHGDGAVGVQLSKPFGLIQVDGDIRTTGAAGDSLVRGEVVRLEAHAFSLKPGATGESIAIGGAVVAENPAIADWDFAAPPSIVGRILVGGRPFEP